jgi:hypothetical protein
MNRSRGTEKHQVALGIAKQIFKDQKVAPKLRHFFRHKAGSVDVVWKIVCQRREGRGLQRIRLDQYRASQAHHS